MIKIYTKLDGKLAHWDVESDDQSLIPELVKELRNTGLPKDHRAAVLAVVPKPKLIVTLNEDASV